MKQTEAVSDNAGELPCFLLRLLSPCEVSRFIRPHSISQHLFTSV